MLQLKNQTPFRATMGIFNNQDGVECVVGIVKATFALHDGAAQLADKQAPIVMTDEFSADPLSSSLLCASEMTLVKPATDILLRGHAHATRPQAEVVDVSLAVGDVKKTVRVFGDRNWRKSGVGFKSSDPLPFDQMPLDYEHAFGGTDADPKDEQRVDYEPRNPIGKGLVPRNSYQTAEGRPLPNLEDPDQLITRPDDRPVPACFGPVCSHWEPRRSYAGTYDESWTKQRAPFLPHDFDSRFFQSAPPDLISDEYLSGGEHVELTNMTADGRLSFDLPICSITLLFDVDGQLHAHEPNLDTVLLDPDRRRLHMVWRACQVVDKKLLRLKHMTVECVEYQLSEVI